MADDPATTVTTDTSGIPRTSTGEIVDPAVAAAQKTTTPSESSGTTLLTEGAPEAKSEAEPKAKSEGEAAKAPETYADYTVPEGYALDAETKTKADALFKGMGLTQDQAQSLVDFYIAETKAAQEAPFTAWSEMQAGWKRDAEAHPDLHGKLGAGKEINVRIGRLLGALPDQQLASDFRSLMDLTGAGNHPAFIRALNHWAEQLSEGTHVAGNGPSPHGQSANGSARRTAAQSLYPNLPSSAS